jgi:nucleotide-binding universal stress UspA family protein
MSIFRKILVPTDFSRHSREAFRVADDLARPTGASVVMFHVSRFPDLVTDRDRGSRAPDRAEGDDVRDESRKTHGRIPAVRIEYETVMAEHPVAQHILRIAEERGCDLVVMGTRVQTGRKHRLLGGVTADVVRSARCPVIVVTAPANESGVSAQQTALQPAVGVRSLPAECPAATLSIDGAAPGTSLQERAVNQHPPTTIQGPEHASLQ